MIRGVSRGPRSRRKNRNGSAILPAAIVPVVPSIVLPVAASPAGILRAAISPVPALIKGQARVLDAIAPETGDGGQALPERRVHALWISAGHGRSRAPGIITRHAWRGAERQQKCGSCKKSAHWEIPFEINDDRRSPEASMSSRGVGIAAWRSKSTVMDRHEAICIVATITFQPDSLDVASACSAAGKLCCGAKHLISPGAEKR
jgi:hypothetical protein